MGTKPDAAKGTRQSSRAVHTVERAAHTLIGMLNAAGTSVPPAVIGQVLVLVLERAAQMNAKPVDPALIKAVHAAPQLPR
jgi:hypothetical protein